ncbi:MAG: GYF domain-containing protein [Myxococcota bacterium]
MKFLCPSCKAKYQISDEKVAGRSVRMKCRKCGHMIQVSSDDAIAGSSAPPPPDGAGDSHVSEAPPAIAATPARAPEKPKGPAAPVPRVGAPAAPSAAKSRVPAPKPVGSGALSPPKPAGIGPRTSGEKAADALRVPRTSPAATREPSPKAPAVGALGTAAAGADLSARAPAKPAPAVASAPVAAPAPAAPAPKLQEEFGEEEATQIARGALIGAFSAAVQEHAPASVADPLSMPGDEWFVGINGVPVGPIRLSELRAKAASGAVTKESLVWRDGFEEWRPLKSFPELVAIVEESLSSARASLPFPLPAAGSAPSTLADPFAAPPPPSTTPAIVAGGVSIDELQALRARPRTSPAAWLAMVVAVLFGITLGFVFFGRADRSQHAAGDKPSDTPVQTAPSAPAPAAAAQPEQKTQDDAQVISGDPKAPSKSGSGSGKTTVAKTETEPKTGTGKSGLGLSGLSANGTKGPSDSSGTSAGPGSGGGQLDQAQLSSVVQRYTPSVKRSCWQPALDGRDKDAPTSARVSVAITISPSGSVQDVNTGADPKGYRGLAQCIAGRVRGWQFPPSGGSTTVNVPFVFVAQ